MNCTVKSLGIDRLGLEGRLALVEEIWETIAPESAAIPMIGPQHSELERRIAEDDAHPELTTSWEEIKAASLSRPAN